jgi:predicted lipid-binding transport protein (Tim44 family)
MNSPLNLFGSLASVVSGSTNQQQQSTGTTGNANQPSSRSLADMIRRSNSTADPSTQTGTTGGLMQGASAGMTAGMNPSTPTGTTGGLMQGASAGMLSGVDTQGGGDVESRITALEQSAPSNTLGNAQPVFNPQTQQAAQGIYGGVDQRQNSVGATPLFQEIQKEKKPIVKVYEPIKIHKKPVYQPSDRHKFQKLEKPFVEKVEEKPLPFKEVINQRL